MDQPSTQKHKKSVLSSSQQTCSNRREKKNKPALNDKVRGGLWLALEKEAEPQDFPSVGLRATVEEKCNLSGIDRAEVIQRAFVPDNDEEMSC